MGHWPYADPENFLRGRARFGCTVPRVLIGHMIGYWLTQCDHMTCQTLCQVTRSGAEILEFDLRLDAFL